LDDKNLISRNILPNIIRDNSIINLFYITKENIDKINLNITYKEKEENKTIKNDYEIISERLEKGENLSKIIIYNYIKNNKNLSENEILQLALRYQIFIKDTSLFAEVNLSEKITEEMKSKIMGDKKSNIIPSKRPKQKKLDAKDLNYLLKQQIQMRFCQFCCYKDDSDDDANADLEFECNYALILMINNITIVVLQK